MGGRRRYRAGSSLGDFARDLGVDRRDLGDAIHTLKRVFGLRGDEALEIDVPSGDVYDEDTGDFLGNVYEEIE